MLLLALSYSGYPESGACDRDPVPWLSNSRVLHGAWNPLGVPPRKKDIAAAAAKEVQLTIQRYRARGKLWKSVALEIKSLTRRMETLLRKMKKARGGAVVKVP